jgi:hypothetical protein
MHARQSLANLRWKKKVRRLGSVLVTFLATQNLVSIVNASSNASRGDPLRYTFALDPLELARLAGCDPLIRRIAFCV